MIEVPIQSNTIEFILLGILLISLGIVRQSEGARLSLFVRSFVNESLASQQIRQERSFNRLAIPVFILSAFSVSLFVTQSFRLLDVFSDAPFIGLFLSVFVGIFFLSAGRLALYSGLSWLFKLERVLSIYSFNWLLNGFMLGIVLVPITAFLAFGPNSMESILMQSGLVVLIIFYLWRALRMFLIILKSFKVPLVYNIFYLCALELLPLVIVITAITRQGLG